jgi:protein gp37
MSNNSKIEWTDATWTPLRARVRQNAAEIARDKGYGSLVQIAKEMAGRVGPHCERVSPGCSNCYSESNNSRCLPANGTGLPFDRRSRDLSEPFVDEEILAQPLCWKKPRKVFVCSQTDLFGEWWTDGQIDRVFAVMALCPQHTFIVLTKRPERMREYFAGHEDDPEDLPLRWGMAAGEMLDGDWIWKEGKHLRSRIERFITYAHGFEDMDETPVSDEHEVRVPLPNVWLGVSVEDQEQADKRIPVLLDTPAAVRFVSAEPLLGPVDLSKFLDFNPGPKRPTSSLALNTHGQTGTGLEPGALLSSGDGHAGISPQASGQWRREPSEARVDWVIVGGESGPYARPMHPDWARSLRDQCQEADVPFFFKQWGEWQNGSTLDAGKDRIVLNDGRVLKSPYTTDQETRDRWSDYHPCMMAPVGKKKAGRLLHGREWNEFPKEETDV